MFGTISPRGVAAAMPRLTEPLSTISWAASSHAALMIGVRRAASVTAFATISSGDTRRSRNALSALSRSTSSIVAVTSTVIHSVTCGAVNALAHHRLRHHLLHTLDRNPGVTLRTHHRREQPVACGRVGAGVALDIRPGDHTTRPLAVTAARSIPRSLANFRTGGFASTWTDPHSRCLRQREPG